MFKFISFYLLWLFAFFLLIDLPFFINTLNLESIHTQSTIKFSSYLIDFIGLKVDRVDGIDIYIGNHILKVVFGCNGLEAIILYFCAILAFPNRERVQKYNWFFWGYLFLFTVNIVRITFLAFVITEYSEYFELMHTYVTQGIMIFIAFALFIYYLKNLNPKRDN